MKLFKLSTLLVLGLVSVSLTSCSNDSIDDIDLDDQEFTEAPTIKSYNELRSNLPISSSINLFPKDKMYSVLVFNSAEELENAQIEGYPSDIKMDLLDKFPDWELILGDDIFVKSQGIQYLTNNFSAIDWDTQSLVLIVRYNIDSEKIILCSSGNIRVKNENVTVALDAHLCSGAILSLLAPLHSGIAVVVDKANVKAENTHVRLNITDYGFSSKIKESEVVWINK